MTVLDRWRLARAVASYDWWLDLRGVRRRRRRELRAELRANLVESSASHGTREAVARLGGLRDMAAEAAPPDRTRPRWSVGLSVAGAALLATLLVELFAALAWVDGATAADPGGSVTGSMRLFPGSSLSYSSVGPGLEMTFAPGWLCLLVAVVVFVVASRAWLVLRARQPARSAG